MLDALISAYPDSLSREDLGAAADIATTGGTFSTYLSDLTRNGLARKTDTGLAATDILMNGADLTLSEGTQEMTFPDGVDAAERTSTVLTELRGDRLRG